MRKAALMVCSSLFLGRAAVAQTQGTKPAFEVASVRRAAAHDSDGPGMMRGGPGSDDPSRITYTNVPLILPITMAYGIKPDQLSGPDWLGTERYDIVAKVPPGTSQQQFDQMMQNLLEERFNMTVHHDTEEFDGYELVLGKNGSKLKESKPEAPAPIPSGFPPLSPGQTVGMMTRGGNGRFMVTARRQSLAVMTDILGAQLHATVANHTGLTGKYDYNLVWVPPRLVDTDGADKTVPDIFTAVQEQAGLKLVKGTIALDIIVIDKASKEPTDN